MNKAEQHPRAKEMGITAGEWLFCPDNHGGHNPAYGLVDESYRPVNAYFRTYDDILRKSTDQQAKANAKLCADAGTVCNQTGRTPSELVELVRELRHELNHVRNLVVPALQNGAYIPGMATMNKAEQLLEKTKDIA